MAISKLIPELAWGQIPTLYPSILFLSNVFIHQIHKLKTLIHLNLSLNQSVAINQYLRAFRIVTFILAWVYIRDSMDSIRDYQESGTAVGQHGIM